MSDTAEQDLIATFRRVFPEYAARFDAAKDEAEIEDACVSVFSDVQNQLNEELATASLSGSKVEKSGAVYLSPSRYQRLVGAQGDSVKTELLSLINDLNDLKAKQHESNKVFAGAMSAAGVLAVVPPTAVPATPPPPFVAALAAGAPEAEAAEAGLATTPPGLVIAIVVAVIVAIIILIYFLTKPSNCITLLINELNEPIEFAGDYNVHGEPATITPGIPPAVTDKDGHAYPSAGFFVSKRIAGFRGTQYGFRMAHQIGHLAFGVCCPLTGSGGPNSCYCHMAGTAQHAAEHTDEYRKQYFEDTHLSEVKISIRCNSKGGSPSYYVARAFA